MWHLYCLNWHLKCQKEEFKLPKRSILNAFIWCFKRQNWLLTFMKWTPGRIWIMDTSGIQVTDIFLLCVLNSFARLKELNKSRIGI